MKEAKEKKEQKLIQATKPTPEPDPVVVPKPSQPQV